MSYKLSLKEEMDVYINNNISPTELFILRLIFLAIDNDTELLSNYISNVKNGKQIFLAVLKSLQEKGIINQSYKLPNEGDTVKFKEIPINKNFVKSYIRDTHELGKELFMKYPSFMTINGKLASIRNITKAGLFDLDAFCNYYAKQIKLCGITHERVMNALDFGIENELIRFSLLEFISSQKWLELEYIRDSGEVNGYSNIEFI